MPPKPQLNLWGRFKRRTKIIAATGLIGATVSAVGANFAGRAAPQFRAEYNTLAAAERAGFIAGKTSELPKQNLWQILNPKDRAARSAQVKTIEQQADRHMQSISTKARIAKNAASQTARFAGPDLSKGGMGRAAKGAKWGGIIGLGMGTGLPLAGAKLAFRRRARARRRQ